MLKRGSKQQGEQHLKAVLWLPYATSLGSFYVLLMQQLPSGPAILPVL